jgi:hypothetical protein
MPKRCAACPSSRHGPRWRSLPGDRLSNRAEHVPARGTHLDEHLLARVRIVNGCPLAHIKRSPRLTWYSMTGTEIRFGGRSSARLPAGD